jgi:predicted dehydrogenase
MKRERKIRFFQADAYISIDYDQKRCQVYRRVEKGQGHGIEGESVEIREGDALADEIDAFLTVVRSRGLPIVSGEDGLRALKMATMISERLG